MYLYKYLCDGLVKAHTTNRAMYIDICGVAAISCGWTDRRSTGWMDDMCVCFDEFVVLSRTQRIVMRPVAGMSYAPYTLLAARCSY